MADQAQSGDQSLAIDRPQHATDANLILIGPDGFHLQVDFPADEPVVLDDQRIAELALPDGRYNFEVRFSRQPEGELTAAEAELRAAGEVGSAPARALAPVSGSLTISDGELLGGVSEEGSEVDPVPGIQDQVINDNLIVVGSTCIGFDCVNNETFSFDTLKLKENNTRMTFIDTSEIEGFAAGDWQLRANDSASGGADHFSIDWLGTTANTGNAPVSTPFRVDGAAPSNALRISTDGLVGLGTATPLRNLHITTGNTPTHRLEQTSGSGFPAQTWDVGANEANFFVRDQTSNNQLPFRIRPGAPTSSIDISAAGNVGIGTNSPAAKLHVSNGDLRVDGAVYQLSSRALKTDFVRFDPGLLLERLARLDLGFWSYLDRRGNAPHFGPAAEDFSELFGLGENPDSISISDMAGVALGAAQALKVQLDERNDRIESLEGEIDQLNHRLQQLEDLIRRQSAGAGQ
jgi:hypothetical protein